MRLTVAGFPTSVALVLAFLGALTLGNYGQASAQLECSASVDRTTVVQGGTVVLTVTAEGDVDGSVDFQLPENLDEKVSGTSYSRSQAYVNGQSSLTIAKTFYLTFMDPGEFTIGPVRVTDSSSVCRTESITLEITQMGTKVPPSVSGNRTPSRRGSKSSDPKGIKSAGGKAGDDIFITLTTDLETVWVGQQMVLTFRYYHRVNPWNQPQFQAPRAPGFWRENLGPQQDFRTTVAGRAYNVTEIRYALFPTHAGELTIEGAELSFPDQGLDRFFSSRRRRGPRTLRTDPIVVKVKSLPPGQPEGFSGLVATQMRLTGQASLDTVPRGEPLDFKVRLVSDAFLKGFEGLKVPDLENARIHDAGEDFRTSLEHNRLMGQITLEKVIVPSEEGRLDLPKVSLSWFDARNGKYRVSNAAVMPVTVVPSDHPFLEQEDSGFLRNEVSRLGQDLVFIHNVPGSLNRGRRVLVHSPLWWGGLVLPLLLLGLFRIYLSRRQNDPVRIRRQRALNRALGILEETGGPTGLSENMARAIHGFVADCTSRSSASVGPVEITAFCRDLGCPNEGDRLLEILESCDTARFGGVDNSAQEQGDKAEVKSILATLHKKLPSGSGASVQLSLLVILALALGGASEAGAAADPSRLMAEGNQAYTEGEVGQALDLYRQALELGAEDPDLYFNLGNAYARNGQLGYAVANYLRARQLAPRDQDIKDNLAWVRGNIQDLELGESQLPLFIAEMVALVFALTLGQWAWLLLGAVWILCSLVAYQWHRGAYPDSLRRLVMAVAVVVLVLTVIVFWRWRVEEVRQTAVVVVDEVAVRSGPDESFGIQFMVHDGLTIRIQEERPQWVRISLGGESLGWMPLSSVEKVRKPAAGGLSRQPGQESQGR